MEGVEPSKTAARNVRRFGHQAFEGTVESRTDTTNLFDLIVGWMALEHFHDPVKDLRKFHSWLKQDGYLV